MPPECSSAGPALGLCGFPDREGGCRAVLAPQLLTAPSKPRRGGRAAGPESGPCATFPCRGLGAAALPFRGWRRHRSLTSAAWKSRRLIAHIAGPRRVRHVPFRRGSVYSTASQGIPPGIAATLAGPTMSSGASSRDASSRRGRSARAALPARCILLAFLLLIPLARGSALHDRACGELYDPTSLGRLRTVCVDTSYLEAATASELREFMARERQPGRFLARMSWHFTDPCEGADAILRVYSALGTHHVSKPSWTVNPNASVPSVDYDEPISQVVLLVYDRASVRLLYRTESQGRGKSGEAAFVPVFSKLVKDVDQLGH